MALSEHSPARVLMLYIEPTPYVLGLISEVEKLDGLGVEAVFITRNLTQAWCLGEEAKQYRLLPAGRMAALRQLSKIISKKRIDLLHLAGWGHPMLMTALVVAFARRIPVAVESDTQPPFKISTIKRALKRLLMPLLFRLPAGFLPGGTRQARYLEHYGVPDEKIQIAQMTVDVERMVAFSKAFGGEERTATRSALGIEGDVPTFLYVGRMEPYKGIRDLITAFNQLRDDGECCRLLLVGDGSLRKELEHISSKNEGVVFGGRLSGETLLGAYNSADVFVLPSTFEPWGLVVNEAMAAGLPVIASSRVGCVEDLVMQGSTGLVYDHASPGGLLNAMRVMMKSEETRKEMGRNAQSLINNWTLAEEAKLVSSLWKRVA